jgi:hypothetical protein
METEDEPVPFCYGVGMDSPVMGMAARIGWKNGCGLVIVSL